MVLRKCGGDNDALSRGIVKEMRLKFASRAADGGRSVLYVTRLGNQGRPS
jgi:hypothetical protein